MSKKEYPEKESHLEKKYTPKMFHSWKKKNVKVQYI